MNFHIYFYHLNYLAKIFCIIYQKTCLFVDLFHFVFLYLFYCCITISYNSLLLLVSPHAIPIDISIVIKWIHKTDSTIELDDVAIIKIVSNYFNIVVTVLYFLNFFFDLWFLSLKNVFFP